MVQIFSTKSHGNYLTEALAPAFGEGLGNFLGQYNANKALDNVLNDPSLENAPPSQRLSKLQTALGPFGERGRKLFQTRLGIEQQRMQEQEMARQQQEQEQEQGILANMLFGGGEVDPKKFMQLPVQTQFKYASLQRDIQNAKAKSEQENLANERFSTGYHAIQSNDNEAFNNIVNDPQTPYNVKRQLTDLRNQREARSNMNEREHRQRQNLVMNAYRQKLNQLNAQIKEAHPKEQKKLQEQVNKLVRQRDEDFNKLAKDPETYLSLGIWNNEAQDFIPMEQNGSAESIAPQQTSPDVAESEEGRSFFDIFKPRFYENQGMQPTSSGNMTERAENIPVEAKQRIDYLNINFPPQQFKGKKKQDSKGNVYESDGRVWRLVQK